MCLDSGMLVMLFLVFVVAPLLFVVVLVLAGVEYAEHRKTK